MPTGIQVEESFGYETRVARRVLFWVITAVVLAFAVWYHFDTVSALKIEKIEAVKEQGKRIRVATQLAIQAQYNFYLVRHLTEVGDLTEVDSVYYRNLFYLKGLQALVNNPNLDSTLLGLVVQRDVPE